MLQQRPGDLLEVVEDDNYYYLVVLTKSILFGGNLVYAFHYYGQKLENLDQLIQGKNSGFNAIVDLIYPKREHRVTRVARIPSYDKFLKTKFFKRSNTLNGKAKEWWIYDLNQKLITRTSKPSREMKSGIDRICYSFTSLVPLIRKGYVPSADPRL